MKEAEKSRTYNYKLEIAYDGTRYQGWQQLGKERVSGTIQGILTEVLATYLKEPVKLIGAGRTDAKVHAKGQVANFHTTKKLDEKVLLEWNQSLPPDIQILSLLQVPEQFHSRYMATGKQYEYQIYCGDKPAPFLRNHCLTLKEHLDIEAMQEAARILEGRHDFMGFASHMSDGRSTVKTIKAITITEKGPLVTIVYEGDGFLYHMLRIITGTLIEIGLHKREKESLIEILSRKDRTLAGPTVEGKGLCLTKIYYDCL